MPTSTPHAHYTNHHRCDQLDSQHRGCRGSTWRDVGATLPSGKQIKPASFNIAAFTLLSADTLRAALQQMQRYQRLISNATRLQLMEDENNSWLIYHPQPCVLAFSTHQIEAAPSTVTY